MLDQETKRKIDTARDILVGKVPDPKSQVEQITIALIYKFMDDIDKSSEELGGVAQFFTDDIKQYSWSKLMDSKLSGQERLNLYTEGISKLGTHKNLPQLFRDIFKGAFLPYRDPNVLHIFLKEINGFTYDNSESLGNAFEYLLSVMGSQGDAGQFRTSRHIIDFIVDVVDPKKDETILDPACGTAGFLISAFKHILHQHDGSKNESEIKEKPLTPDEREKLMEHFVGYDISPDMVRLSLVNMYLHGFQSPKIFEYDTLGSEDRWDERYDVILANPPFMTPTGGVRPHRRFSIQANRTEVLFVDYIAEHLTSEGRAGIIVPEGIIFKNDGAYKKLRKMLIEEAGLYAVVSLPAGVFNPYSNVKTSILFLDKKHGKAADKILFIKIENDGFDLGTQRRSLGHNGDIPESLKLLKQFKYNNRIILDKNSKFTSLVSKETIIADSNVNLSKDHYEESNELPNQKWPMEKIGSLITTITPPSKIQKSNFEEKGKFPIIDQSQEYISGWTDNEKALVLSEKPVVIFGDHTCCVKYIDQPFVQGADGIKILKTNEELSPNFLFHYLSSRPVKSDGYKRHFSKLKDTLIPLPPLDIQNKIVEEIEIKQNAINAAKELIGSLERERRYFGQSIAKLEGIEWVELGEISEINPKKSQTNDLAKDTMVSFVPMADVSENRMFFKPREQKQLSDVSGSYTYFAEGDVLLAKVTPCFENGKAGVATGLQNGIGFGSSEFIVLRPSERVLPEIVYAYISSIDFREIGKRMMTGTGGLQRIPTDFVKGYKVPLPSTEDQQRIAEEIRRLESAIELNSQVVEWYQQKIDEVIGNV
jgi:type I restriction enzyme M protein